MALFDKLSKTVTEASQKTIAKTKELADTTKLNAMITDEEKLITKQYYQIGELYAIIHKDDFEEVFAELMEAVIESEEKIKTYKRQIQAFKNIRQCEKCGAEVSIDAAFCGECGASMPKYEPPITLGYAKCEHCGTEVKEGMKFCIICGNPMPEITEKDITLKIETEETVEEKTIPDKSVERFCQNCGEKMEDGLKFCTECGAQF